MMFYLKTAERDVRGYGTALFEIGTKFEPHKLLSVSPSSITLSTADFKDEESFRWAEIRSAAQVDKKITIKLRSLARFMKSVLQQDLGTGGRRASLRRIPRKRNEWLT